MGSAPVALSAGLLGGAAAGTVAFVSSQTVVEAVGDVPGSGPATLAVLLALFALGALGAGVLAQRSARPARAAAVSLLVAGLFVALSPWITAGVASLLVAIGPQAPSPWIAPVATMLVAGPAALSLGALLPWLIRSRIVDLRRVAGRGGRLAAAALAGAAGGVVFVALAGGRLETAFLLRAAAAATGLGALLLLAWDRPLPHGSGPPAEGLPGRQVEGRGPVLALFVGGAALLGAVAAWLRLVTPLAGSHPLVTATVAALVLAGLSGGTLVGSLLATRLRRSDLALTVALAAGGVLLIVSLATLDGMAARLLVAGHVAGPGRVEALVADAALAIVPATAAFGAALPLALRVRADWTGTPSRALGRLIAWMLTGGVSGVVGVALLLLPAVGATRVLLLLGIGAVGIAAWLRLAAPETARVLPALMTLAPLGVLAMPGVLEDLLAAAPDPAQAVAAARPMPRGLDLEDEEDARLYATLFGGAPAAPAMRDAPLPVLHGATARAAFLEEPGGRIVLRADAETQASFAPDDPEAPDAVETATAAFAALARPPAGPALVVGHGSGAAIEMLLALEVEGVEVAEPHPVVLRAVATHRRTPLAVARGRAALELSDGVWQLRRAARREEVGRYGIVLARGGGPAGVAALLAPDRLDLVVPALRRDGVFAGVLPHAALTPDLMRRILRAFRERFDGVWVVRLPGHVVLVGLRAPAPLDVERVEAAFRDERSSRRLAEAGFPTPGALLKLLAADAAGIERIAPDVEPLPAEPRRFTWALARRAFAAESSPHVAPVLGQGFPPDFAAIVPDVETRERWLAQALESWVEDEQPRLAVAWDQALTPGRTVRGLRGRARVAAATGRHAQAARMLAHAAERATGEERAEVAVERLEVLGRVTGDARPAARDAIRRIVSVYEQHGPVLAAAGTALRRLDALDEGRSVLERAVAADDPPAPPGTGALLARLVLALPEGDPRRAFEHLARDPAHLTDPGALDLYVRLFDRDAAPEGERLEDLDAALTGMLERDALASVRAAQAAVAAHDFVRARQAAEEALALRPQLARAWTLRGFATLALSAYRPARETEALQRLAVEHFVTAVERADDAEAMRRDAARMLGWYGVAAAALEAAEATGSR